MIADTGIGAPVRRVEDRRFLLGRGRFVGDIHFPAERHCMLVRSPHAHAMIHAIDTREALRMPGVEAVVTGADMAADGIAAMNCLWPVRSPSGARLAEPPRWHLARGTVRHVGEAVAAVVAGTRAEALDAAEAVRVDWEPLAAIVEGRAALGPDAPPLHEAAPGNVAFRWELGDAAAVRRTLDAAPRVVTIDLVNNRLVGAAIEPRAVIAAHDPATGRLTVFSATQVPHFIRRQVAEALGLPEGAVRVVAPDVGGGFGYKGKHYPEETILAWLARRLGGTVRWEASRSESFLSDYQARDHATVARLGLDDDGHFLALEVATVANLGAYVSSFGAAIPSAIYTALLAGVYRTPAIHVVCTGVFTNTVPTDAYRGAGRPEACYVLERLADRAAEALDLNRTEIRRRNLVPASAMPYKTPLGPLYDCGDFPAILKQAVALWGYTRFGTRRVPDELLRGMGMACYVESSGVAPSRLAGALGARVGLYESAQVRVDSEGSVRAMLGTHNHGQGHATTFAQILSDALGVPLERIEIVEGDTDAVPYGTGTFGSRSIAVGGSALKRAADKVIAKGKRIAAHLLEAAEGDIEFRGGTFSVTGTDRCVSFAEVARTAYIPHNFPHETLEPGLDEQAFYDPPSFAFSNGAHLAEVEVDPETGAVRLAGYFAVDDIGRVINPLIVEGQLAGGIAQGAGQALLEHCAYDGASAQLLAGSFMDYAVPRADDLPAIVSRCDERHPCTHNPLGAKGCGEAGSIAAPAAIVAAVLDALRPLGVRHLEMPLTPERVWRAIQAGANDARTRL